MTFLPYFYPSNKELFSFFIIVNDIKKRRISISAIPLIINKTYRIFFPYGTQKTHYYTKTHSSQNLIYKIL